MDQSEIIAVLNRHVFSTEKVFLLQAIAENPNRFVGVFRSTTPRLKLLQYLLQSREIRFGDALEEVIAKLLDAAGFHSLQKQFQTDEKDDLSCDQYFATPDWKRYYLVEQKVRDDHDSTKKRGQIENFGKKLAYLKAQHGDLLVGIMYFIDPALHKNRNYYEEELCNLQVSLNIPIFLFYNGELWQHLDGSVRNWELLLESLKTWRLSLPASIEFNYDLDPELIALELAVVPPGVWCALLVNDELWRSDVLKTLFPTGATLGILEGTFRSRMMERWGQRKTATYGELANLMKYRLDKHYEGLNTTELT